MDKYFKKIEKNTALGISLERQASIEIEPQEVEFSSHPESVDESEESVDEISEKNEKKRKYVTVYNPLWEQIDNFKAWLQPSNKQGYIASCTICSIFLKVSSGKNDLVKHSKSEKHLKNSMVCALTKRDIMQPEMLLSYSNNNNNNAGIDHHHHYLRKQQHHYNGGDSQVISSASSASGYTNSILKLSPSTNNFIANAGLSYEDVLNDDFQFDMDGHDVMVFLHVQKTGGTSFGRHLVRDLDLKRPCECQRKRKRCYCFRPHRNENWLFSRYSTGWKCGLHADWTELTSCVDQELDKNEGETAKRRYFYITLLREPTARYMSEYRHVKRGATWKGSRHWCLGRQATPEELPPCYSGQDWLDVTLDEFANCDSNLAINRQTRMLADLALIGCYNKTIMPSHERDRVMLASAKRNLAAMSYFGLTEYQKISQYIFEETFNLRFAIPFEQHNTTISVNAINNLKPNQRKKIEKLNALDLELYSFAKNLLFQRYRWFNRLKAKDNDFERRFANLGNINYKQGVTEFNWESNIDETGAAASEEDQQR